MKTLALLSLLAATAAHAQSTKLIGFVTVGGRHPALPCASADQRVGTLVLTDGTSELQVPLTCEGAPAVAFSAIVPSGTWRVSVSGPDLKVPARKLVVTGARQLVTLEASKASPLALHQHHRDRTVASSLGDD